MRYRAVRSFTMALTAPLSDEDCVVQSMPDASPTKWHLAHTTWFFETFVLARAVPGYHPFHPRYGFLFNSYYDAVGERHPRPSRGLLTRPSLPEVRQYRAHVDEAMNALLEREGGLDSEALRFAVMLGLHHEQQHQELLLTDIRHALHCNPLRPAYRDRAPQLRAPTSPPPLSFLPYPEASDLGGSRSRTRRVCVRQRGTTSPGLPRVILFGVTARHRGRVPRVHRRWWLHEARAMAIRRLPSGAHARLARAAVLGVAGRVARAHACLRARWLAPLAIARPPFRT